MSRPPLVLRLLGAESNQIQFAFRDGRSRVTYSFPRDDLRDVGDSRIIERDAGRLVLDGSPEDWLGSGEFNFTPAPAYTAELKALLGADPSLRDLFGVFMEKLPLAYIRAAGASLETPKLGDILQLRHHGVTADYLQQTSAAGVRRVDDIVRLRVHGVSADFPQVLAAAGYRYSPEEIVQLRVHGVSARYAADWKRAGYNLAAKDLIQLRIHGVEPELGLARGEAAPDSAAPLPPFAAQELIKLRNHGVRPDQVRDWQRAGFHWTADELVRLRQHGVNVDYARATLVPGRPPLTADTLIELRQRGVSPELARRMQP